MIDSKHMYKPLWLIMLITTLCWSCDDNDDDPTAPPTVTSAVMNANVGGATQPNQVFIDLSTETQTVVNRSSWDLGFANGNDFRVVLNGSVGMLAMAIEATDLNAVTAEDTVGLGAQLDMDAIFNSLFGAPPAWLADVAGWVDDPSGDLDATAIAEVSSSASANQVYIVNRGKNPDGTPRGWMKIRILRDGNGYTLQYAEVSATTFQELNVVKSNDYNFNFVSFDNEIVRVEPAKNSWDIAFTTFTNLLELSPTTSIPYAYKDFVIQNKNGVTVSQVTIDASTTYETFTLADTENLEMSRAITTIGSGWRVVAQPGSTQATGVKEDVFYAIKDPDNNYYKLRFNRMLDPVSGERGFPQVQYDLLTNEID